MKRIRVIPVLLLKGSGLYKTVKFKDPKYVGDPLNAVKIFNDKEVDELCFLDITATNENRDPNYKLIAEIASECFMPLSYGGGIKTLDQAKKLFGLGIEKIILNTSVHSNPLLIEELASHFGSQSILVSIDVKKNFLGSYEIYTNSGTKNTGRDPVNFALEVQKLGAGELIVNSIEREGTMRGYEIDIISKITKKLDIPVIACGGASCVDDFYSVVKEGNASAVGAGSLFVYHGKHRAVLISYPTVKQLKELNVNL